MAEIKQNFSAGKMNKDLDERLLPKGQYRHAENIQVSTSEDSDVGAIENILSNTKLSNIDLEKAFCVGVYANEKENAVYWFVTSLNKDMILRYKSSTVTPVLVDVNKNVLRFNDQNLENPNTITGINIIDNLLFWTDNYTEPKKINIDLCIEGSNNNFDVQTKLIVSERDINLQLNVTEIREEHITVIKKSPKTKLQLEPNVETTTTADLIFDFMTIPPFYGGGNAGVGDIVIIPDPLGSNFNSNSGFSNFIGEQGFSVGDELLFLRSDVGSNNELTDLPDKFDIKAKIVSNLSGQSIDDPTSPVGNYTNNTFSIEILEVNEGFTSLPQNYALSYWFVYKGSVQVDFFEKQFARFSYRYKYQDGEYSTFAPFSNLAFEPGVFDYETKKAYNLGMENKLKSLKLRNFVEPNILEDVVQIDLLYKESNSPNVYLVDKIKYKDYKDIIVEVGVDEPPFLINNWEANKYIVTSDTIYSVLPSNQILRPYDNVPKKALAQEITGNRVVYGNYTQNYNLDEKPLIEASFIARSGFTPTDKQPEKSLKSSRNYQLGIVYLDEYGRQTPVFSSSRSSFKIPKEQAENSNSIQFAAVTNAPSWADSYKIYVKETSNEYYNLAMDRVYKAKDGNIWMAFPSSERNKVDEETFLILKKKIDEDEQVVENLKYKIIAIENEAPVEVKSNNILITESNGTGDIELLFSGDTPQIGSKEFQIHEATFKADGGPSIDNLTETLSIVFKDGSESILSDFYEIASIEFASPYYNISLVEKIKDKESWIYTDFANTTTFLPVDLNNNLSLKIYKDVVKEQPEFDGKFFVKILNDSLTEKYVLKSRLDPNNFISTAYLDVFYISDTQAFNHSNYTPGLLPQGSTGTTAKDPFQNNSQSDTRSDWVLNALQFNNNTYSSEWFIDQAMYASKHPESNKLNDSVNNNSGAWEMNAGLGSGFGKGIYKVIGGGPGGEDQWYMELSFSLILPNAEEKFQNHAVNWGAPLSSGNSSTYGIANASINVDSLQRAKLFAVGSSINQEHADQVDITKNLSKNKLFRFVGDTEKSKYIINGDVVKEKRYNYKSFAQVKNAWETYLSAVSNSQGNNFYIPTSGTINTLTNSGAYESLEEVWDHFSEFVNRRVTYIIPFALWEAEPDLDINGAPIYSPANPLDSSKFVNDSGVEYSNFLDQTVDSGKVNGATNDNPSAIQFLEPNENEDDQLVSSNPAIWETEPKENIDLDIYYEASSCYDISLHGTTQELDWFNCYSFGNGVESNRLRDDFNQVTIDKGAIASSTVDFVYEEENRKNGLIYSGIYNSTSGVNNLNQFIGAEKITKDINPTYGSIQKLFSRNTDLITFCEDKVIKVLANKDAIFNADGNPQLIATQNVLGQTIPFVGDYGISQNPESFAKESYRAYFTDKNRGKVLRLSRDGITPISDYGMSKYFKDQLKNQPKLIGSYDQKKNEYNLSLKFNTVSYDEKVKGWSSFKSFVPEQGVSVTNFYYTFKNGNLYKHHDDYALGLEVTWNNFYGKQYESKVRTVLNDAPSDIKSFKTVNYEGSQSNVVVNLNDSNYYNLYQKDGWSLEKITTDKESGFIPEFIEKEGKWFNNVKGDNITTKQEIDTSSFSFQGLGIASSTQFLLVPKPVKIFVEIYKTPNLQCWFKKNNNKQGLFIKSDFNDVNEVGNNPLNPNVVVEEIVGGNLYRHGEPVNEIVQFKIRGGIDISQPAQQRPDGTYMPRPPIPIAASEFTLRHLSPPGNDGERSRAFDADGAVIGAIAVNDGAGGGVEDLGVQESTLRNEANPNTNIPGPGFLGSTFSPISANVNFIDTGIPGESGNTVLVNVPIKFIIPSNVEQMETIKIELFLEQNSNNI